MVRYAEKLLLLAALFAVAGLLVLDGMCPAATKSLAGSIVGRTIVVDPGHGGPDPGSVGRAGTLEKQVVLAVAEELRRYYRGAGITVVMTRTEDKDLSELEGGSLSERKRQDLLARSELINSSRADAAVSIHANAIGASRWYGAQTFFNSENEWAQQSKRLAQAVQAALRESTDTNRAASDKIRQFILEQAKLPAVNVEVGFLTNPREERLLTTPAYQRRVAWAIFLGTARYFVEGALPAVGGGQALVPACVRVWEVENRLHRPFPRQVNPLSWLLPMTLCGGL